MVTVNTSTIGTGVGRDYSTISAWESDTVANLVSLDDLELGEIYDDGDIVEVGEITIGGATTDSTRYRHLRAASGHEYDPRDGSGVVVTYTATLIGAIQFFSVSEGYCRVENFAVIVNPSNSSIYNSTGFRTTTTSAVSCFVNSIYSRITKGTSTVNRAFRLNRGTDCEYVNCIASGPSSTTIGTCLGFSCGNNQSGTLMSNCIAHRCTMSGSGVGFKADNSGTLTMRNCIAFHNDTDYDTSDIDVNEDYNYSEDTTAAGSNSLTSQSDPWVDHANGDFTLAIGSAARDAGQAQTGTIWDETDFVGNSHNDDSSGWEMGPYDSPELAEVVTETEGITEGTISGLALNTFGDDTEAITEATLKILGFNEKINDSEEVTETVVNLLGQVRDVSDTEAVVESVLTNLALTRPVNETQELVESVVRLLVFVRQVDEVEAIVEAVSTALTLIRPLGESVAISETASAVVGLIDAVSETLAISETIVSVTALGNLGCFESVANKIQTYVKDEIDEGLGYTVQYDNFPDVKIPTMFLEMYIDWGANRQMSYGETQLYRKAGDLVIRVHDTLEDGPGASMTAVEQIEALFRYTLVGNEVRFDVPSHDVIGVVAERWITEIRCPWRVTHSKPHQTQIIRALTSSVDDAATAIRTRLSEVLSGENVAWENSPYTPPENEEFVAVSIQYGDTQHITSAQGTRTQGAVVGMIMAPLETGVKESHILLDLFFDFFKSIIDGPVRFKTPSATRLGRVGSYWRLNIRCPFEIDRVVT